MKFIAQIEDSIFAGQESYRSMGGWIYYIAALVGAAIGLVAAYATVNRNTDIESPMIYILTAIFMTLCAWCVMDSLVRVENLRVAWAKATFNCAGVLVAMVVGFIGSVIVLILLALILLFLIFTGALKGSTDSMLKSEPDSVTTSDGTEMEHVTGNIYRSSRDGCEYEKIGDTMRKIN